MKWDLAGSIAWWSVWPLYELPDMERATSTKLHAELSRGSGFTLGNAFHFARMQLVLVSAFLSQVTASAG